MKEKLKKIKLFFDKITKVFLLFTKVSIKSNNDQQAKAAITGIKILSAYISDLHEAKYPRNGVFAKNIIKSSLTEANRVSAERAKSVDLLRSNKIKDIITPII